MTNPTIFKRSLSSRSINFFRGLFALIFALSLIGVHPAAADNLASCTNCAITTVGDNVIYTFTSGSGTFTPSAALSVNMLLVAGGGGGGGKNNISNTYGGGGGAGGLIAQNGVSLTNTTYSVTVGVGGTAGTNNTKGGSGGASSITGSSFTTISATGGGGGGTAYSGQTTGASGGSGGGGGRGGSTSGTGGTGTTGQGYAGADAISSRGGGGGGATAAGLEQNGGDGSVSNITGTSVMYAGGGGGGGSPAGTGGNGGGGAGNSSGAGTAGAANTGGGGGGGSNATTSTANGGAGGSGIVVISYNLAPTIATSGTLTAFSTPPGMPSDAQTYTVSGSNLTANININAPEGFELSTDGSTYTSSLMLTQSGGLVSSTTVYVRLSGTDEGTFSGDIAHTSSGAADLNKAVNGIVAITPITVNFQDGVDGYTGTRDTYIFNTDPSTVRGSETTFVQDYDSDTVERRSLLLFDLSSIPAGSTITSAEFEFYITAEGQGFNMYRMLIPWDEATVSYASIGNRHFKADDNDAESSVDANWSGHDGLTGFSSVSIPAATIQDWIGGTTTNNGWLMIATDIPGGDGQQLASREATTQVNRPKLTVEYYPSTDPNIATSDTLTVFATQPGIPSVAQTYTVSGSNLTDDILISAPTGFELSTDNATWFSSLTLSQSGGAVAATTVFVHLNSAIDGNFSGNIEHTSNGVMTRNVIVSGTVSLCSTISLVAAEDTYLSANDVTFNNGGNTELHVDATTGTNRRSTLLKWDLNSIPTNVTVTSASLSLFVTDASSLALNLYSLRQAWVEGTSNRAASTTSANWNTYDGDLSWESGGAAGTSTDRYDTNLWAASTSSFSSTGSKTEALNNDGVAVVQGWIAGSTNNNGLTIQNFSGSTSNAVFFSSREAATEANRPKLNLTYCLASGTTHTLMVGNDGHGTVTLSPAGGIYNEGTSVTLTPVPISGYEFATWSGTNAADPNDNGNGTWSLIMDGDKSLTANFSISTANVAPDQPVLVKPAINTTDVSIPPTLEVTASDPNASDTLSVNFYGREVGTTPGADFTLVVIPDAQNYATSYPDVYTNHLQWVANNKTASNIVFATSVGDLVNTSTSSTEYSRADIAFDTLDTGGVSYSVSPGNHDMGTGSLYNNSTYFGTSRFSGKSWYQGYLGSDNYNNYSFFSASGMDFILINLQYSPGTTQLDWADNLLKTNPGRRGIVVQHDILNTNNSFVNQASFTALKDNPNLFLMLCGHMHASNDGAAYRSELGDDGHTIHIVMADYQDFAGSGYLRILRFSPADDMIYMTTYSPISGGSITTSPDKMNLAYDMVGSSPSYTLIGTVPGIANGSNASISWPGRSASTEYEWYATVTDGSLTTNGPTWSFTTGTGTNSEPVISESDPQAVTMSEDGDPTAFTLMLHATDSDVGDTLTWSILTPALNGTATTSGVGSPKAIEYLPSADYNGSDHFEVQVSDDHGGTDSITVNVTIIAVNDAPQANSQNVTTDKDTPKAITLTGSDIDSSTLAYIVVSVPDHGDLTGTAPDFTYHPDAGYSGPDSFTFIVNDGVLDSNIATVMVEVNASTPPLLPSSFYGEIHINDDPPSVGGIVEAYVPGASGAVANITIMSDSGILVYTINVPKDDGSGPKQGGVEGDEVTFKIGGRIVAAGTWHESSNVQLNFHPPEALPGGPYTGTPGSPISFIGSANDTGSDATTYQWDWDNDGIYDETDPTPSHTWPDYGDYTIGLKVTNSQGGEGAKTTTVAVINQAPIMTLIGDKSVNELDLLAFTATAGDFDPISFSLVNAPAGASITTGGAFTWIPSEAQGAGEYTFTVKVCDNQVPSLCDEEEITVTVNEVNVAPVLGMIGAKSVAELATLNFTATATDGDLPANTLTYSLANGSSGSVPAGATIGISNGAFSWTPTEAQGPDSYTFDVCVSDGSTSDCETITVTINEVNAAPILASIGNKSVAELATLSFTVTATDNDLPANTLTYSLANGSSGSVPAGATIGSSTGAFSWTPTEAQGPDSYTFDVCVSDGSTSDCETITVTINEVNAAPILASIGNKSVAELATLSFTVTATDNDLPANTLTYSLANGSSGSVPAGATIGSSTGAFSWTPTEAQGPDSYIFDVCVSDGSLSDCETLIVDVTASTVSYSVSLTTGWNLVSFDIHPTSTAVVDVLSTLGSSFDLVYAWNAGTSSWMKYDPSMGYGDTLSALDETMGFWIYMNTADTLVVSGTLPTTSNITLKTGWNLVGFPSAVNLTLPEAFSGHGVGTDFSLVYAYHADDTTDQWRLFDRSSPEWANDLTELAPGWGYWVKVSADHIWVVAH